MSVADQDHEPEAGVWDVTGSLRRLSLRSLGLIEARAAQAGDETLMSAVTVGRQALAAWQKQADRLRELEGTTRGRPPLSRRHGCGYLTCWICSTSSSISRNRVPSRPSQVS